MKLAGQSTALSGATLIWQMSYANGISEIVWGQP